MAIIHVDGKAYTADADKNLLDVCLSLKFDLPYFCWHPDFGSIGACRQCAVTQYRDEHDDKGRIIMACMTPAADGTRIAINDAASRHFRAKVIEWLMINHPHDCPVCEEGGECHLQDMTLLTGHSFRRYRGKKRTFHNQYLGPFINHEMNRCITCYRCVRFYSDYAGGRDLQAMASKNWVYFGRDADGTLENEFSGNLAEVCPTGVFTDRPFSARYNRKWDLRSSPSICHHCGLGCNISPNERDGVLRRIVNRYHGEVNGYFICDRGRFGYEYVNSPERIIEPQRKELDGLRAEMTTEAVVGELAPLLRRRGRVIGIGSPLASLEDNFALRTLVGEAQFHTSFSTDEQRLLQRIHYILRLGPVRTPSLREVEQSDAVLIIGEDISNTAPRLALSVRQASRHAAWRQAEHLGIARWNDAVVRNASGDLRSPVYVFSGAVTRLDDIATATLRAAPDDLARVAFATAHAIDDTAPAVQGLSTEQQQLVSALAIALQSAERPLIVSGTSNASTALVEAAAQVAWALHRKGRNAALSYTVNQCNAMGLALMGGGDYDAACAVAARGEADVVIVLDNALRQHSDLAIDRLFEHCTVITLDYLMHRGNEHADYILPTGTFAEGDGTLVNSEGRAQRYFQLIPSRGSMREAWRWLQALAPDHITPHWRTLDDVTRACAAAVPELASIIDAAPPSSYRVAGMKIAREPQRYSGRTALHADVDVHERKPPDDQDTPLSYTMEGYYGDMPSALLPYFWSPPWNSNQSVFKFQDEVAGRLEGRDSGVRLIEPPTNGLTAYFTAIPQAFSAQPGRHWVMPLHHVFGSEPLSLLSPGIAERVPAPYIALHPEDAPGIKNGGRLSLMLNDISVDVAVQLRLDIPRGVVGIACLPSTAGLTSPRWISFKEADT